MLRALELINLDLSARDALRCFGWSRMLVEGAPASGGAVDATEAASVREGRRRHAAESHLWLEGFIEALCRLATLKALPDDETIKTHVGEGNTAADLLARWGRDDMEHLNAFRRQEARPWGAVVDAPSFHRRVDHTISLVEAAVELRWPIAKRGRRYYGSVEEAAAFGS